jgi:hypothetical protein
MRNRNQKSFFFYPLTCPSSSLTEIKTCTISEPNKQKTQPSSLTRFIRQELVAIGNIGMQSGSVSSKESVVLSFASQAHCNLRQGQLVGIGHHSLLPRPKPLASNCSNPAQHKRPLKHSSSHLQSSTAAFPLPFSRPPKTLCCFPERRQPPEQQNGDASWLRQQLCDCAFRQAVQVGLDFFFFFFSF